MAQIGDVMRHCRNYFEGEAVTGACEVDEHGRLTTTEPIGPARFVAIRGSACHDGVWRCREGWLEQEDGEDLPAERFAGQVWPLYPPREFVRLCGEIAAFEAETPRTAVASESFGSYSHSVTQGQSGPLTWQEAYAQHLLMYRRMFTEVGV